MVGNAGVHRAATLHVGGLSNRLSVNCAHVLQVNLVYQNYNRGRETALVEVCHSVPSVMNLAHDRFPSTLSSTPKAATSSLPTPRRQFQMVLSLEM